MRVVVGTPLVLPIICGLVGGCASSYLQQNSQYRPALASIQSGPLEVETGGADNASNEDTEQPSAAVFLEEGFAQLREDRGEEAVVAFRAAIASDQLNDQGKALAYWHIYVGEQFNQDAEAGAEALASFVVIGEDVLIQNARQRAAHVDDFIERFQLLHRLARARGILSALWAARTDGFGLSPHNPVPVRSDAEVEVFLEFAPPCPLAPERRVRRFGPSDGTVFALQATVSCPEREVTYFFESE